MVIVPTIFGVAALASWIAAFVYAIRLVRHRKPGLTMGTLMFRGHMFYSRDNFTEAGASAHRGFMLAVLGFVLCLGALIASSVALAPPPSTPPSSPSSAARP